MQMHFLSARHHSEFSANPVAVRLTLAQGQAGKMEPALLIKASTLTLKYLRRLRRFSLVFMRAEDWLIYGTSIQDDPNTYPSIIWSLLEQSDEVDSLAALIENPKCQVFLFNEISVNVAQAEIDLILPKRSIQHLLQTTKLHPGYKLVDNQTINQKLDALARGEVAESEVVDINITDTFWQEIRSHYITNRIENVLLSIFEIDEGGQQEAVGLWLIDALQPTGALRNPQVHESRGMRELTDLLLSYESGVFLFESKVLSILDRPELPTWSELKK
jgi:hypothetical protein